MRQLLRVGATTIALITTGLALVAVGPAAHATVTPRTLSQASDTVTENHTTICTKDGSKHRRRGSAASACPRS